MQASLSIADKLLEDARKTLASRAEEMRAYERRATEATQTRDAIETKFSHAERLLGEQEDQIAQLQHSHEAAAERVQTLEQTLRSRDGTNWPGAGEDRLARSI